MGYRSEVYLGVDKELVEKVLTFVGLNQDVYKLMFEYADEVKKTNKGGIFFRWEDIKWYDGFDEISKLHDFLNENDDHYRFFRMGENVDDVDEQGYSDNYYFELSRQVHVGIE